jgi:hypothetical protein
MSSGQVQLWVGQQQQAGTYDSLSCWCHCLLQGNTGLYMLSAMLSRRFETTLTHHAS